MYRSKFVFFQCRDINKESYDNSSIMQQLFNKRCTSTLCTTLRYFKLLINPKNVNNQQFAMLLYLFQE